MLLFVDIDQFLIVYRIIRIFGSTNISDICLNSNVHVGFNYLPKELFNMSQVRVIYLETINRYGTHHYNYNCNAKAPNHDSCRWQNFINLHTVYNLKNRTITENKNIIQQLLSIRII